MARLARISDALQRLEFHLFSISTQPRQELNYNALELCLERNFVLPEHPAIQASPMGAYDGSEPFFAFFSQAQVAVSTLRLSLEGRIVAQTSDLGSQLETVRRTFQHSGDFVDAIQDAIRIGTQLQQRIQSWEREVQNLERTKLEKSGARLQQIKSEIAFVRTRSQSAARTLSKLEIILHQLEAEESEKQSKKQETPLVLDAESEAVILQAIEAIELSVRDGIDIPIEGDSVVESPLFLFFAQRRQLDFDTCEVVFTIVPKFKDLSHLMASIMERSALHVALPNQAIELVWKSMPAESFHCESTMIQSLIQDWIRKRFGGNPSQMILVSSAIPNEWAQGSSIRIERKGDNN